MQSVRGYYLRKMMFKVVALFLIVSLFVFTGCMTQPKTLPSNAKAFEDEDRFVIWALYAKGQGDANASISLYELLYEKSHKKEYRNEELITMLQSRQSQRALERIDLYRSELGEGEVDVQLERFRISALMELRSYEKAKDSALSLLEKTKESYDYQQVAAIYMTQGRYEIALRYLQSAYAINYDEKILDKMAIILYVNLNQKAQAVSYLETHIRLHGCSETICLRLGSFYSEENNIDGMLRIYLRLYENTKDDKYAKTIIKLYNYRKDVIPLIQFLEKSGSDDAMLLQLYISTKNFARVVSLGERLYQEDGDPYYLGQSAIFEYEGAKDKQDKKTIDSVMKKLQTVLESSQDPVYLNYLGYLLIDHDIDVKRGIEYVKKALQSEKDSPYYLDSLAWGYYKQEECEKALNLMKEVRKNLGKNDPEVDAHVKQIQQCIKRKGN